MDAGRVLRQARLRAGLTQRELARASGIPQPSVARIEKGLTMPGVDTLDRLLEACGETLEAVPRPGRGRDRRPHQELLALTPRQRLDTLGGPPGIIRSLPTEAGSDGRPG